ncbi:MAG: 2OG-Fe(II) oxygenase [Alphaproteobacteria bacterium]
MTFRYYDRDVTSLLPQDWQEELIKYTEANALNYRISPTSVTSREIDPNQPLNIYVVTGEKIKTGVPWLYKLYENELLDIVQKWHQAESVFCDPIPTSAVNINMQKGKNMRYEAHVDTGLAGLLYVTGHPPGSGGELVVANNSAAVGTEAIDSDCVKIYPKVGNFVFFDAREHPHYVTSLNKDADCRIAVIFNYYSPSCKRPTGLDQHLYGTVDPNPK